jgi:hypothetical protein
MEQPRKLSGLVPGSSPGRPNPSETTIYLRKSGIKRTRNDPHENTRNHLLFVKYPENAAYAGLWLFLPGLVTL